MTMRNSFFFALFVRIFEKKNSGQLQRKVGKFGQIYLPSCTNVI
jgi:hypothetical protein